MAETIRLNRRQVQHIVTLVVAAVLIATAMTSSWWTRGYTVEGEPGEDVPNLGDTFTVSYGPFNTPNYGPFQFDSVREVAVTVTGIAVVLCALAAIGHNLARWGIESGRLEVDRDLPVHLAMAAFILGTFGVLFALFWPFMGSTNAGIFANDVLFDGQSIDGGSYAIKSAEFLNVGFFLGIFAFMVYPAYLWASADALRAETAETTGFTA